MRKQKIFNFIGRAVLLIAATLQFTGMASASQIRIVENNAEIAAVVAAGEPSRVSIEGDRIASVVVDPAGFAIESDEDTGDIYIVPFAGIAINKPINMFITSETGRSYQLFLEPRNIPSEQILIRHAGAIPGIIAPQDTAPRREELGRLVRAVITGELLDDYTRSGVASGEPLINHPLVEPVEVWRGAKFAAWRLRLLPHTEEEVPSSRLFPGAAALWISPAGQEAVVVMEIKNGR